MMISIIGLMVSSGPIEKVTYSIYLVGSSFYWIYILTSNDDFQEAEALLSSGASE